MNTKPDPMAGPAPVSVPSSLAATVTGAHPRRFHRGHHKRRPGRLLRLLMHSPVIEPFRHVMRPLWRWTWKPRLNLFTGDAEPVNWRPPSGFMVVLSLILGPLVFVMLLPLVLILIPVFLFVGVLAVLATCLQFSNEEPLRGRRPAHS